MTRNDDEWTPYGLEAIRHAHLRRRRILGALLILGVLLGASALFRTDETRSLSIVANGQETQSGIEIRDPNADQEEKKDYVTVSLEPGKVARLETGSGTQEATVERSGNANIERAKPVPWRFYLVKALPFLLTLLAGYLLAGRRGRHDEVNYGIHKGSMPLEMITAHHDKAVFTRRFVKSSVFGKRRHDYVDRNVERVTQEDG